MKITLFIDALGAGGAQRQIVGLACLLKRASYDVEVLTYHYMDFYDSTLQENRIPHVTVKNAKNKIRRIWAVSRYLKMSKPDVVIAYQRSPAFIASVVRLFNHNFKLIVSERNTSQAFTKSERLRFNLYRIADYVVPNSYSQRDFINIHAPYLENKTITITNFVDTDIFKPKIVDNDRFSSNNVRLLTIARITPQKNILNYIDSISKVRNLGYDVKVDWYGYADQGGAYKVSCVQKIKDLKLDDVFVFHDPIKDVITEYNNCDAFVLPSIFEGTPNVVCEAMSCGTPILCSNVCDNARIVENYRNGYLFDPLNVKQMVNTIVDFCKLNKDERLKMSLASRVLAEVNFSSNLFRERYIDLIRSINHV